jgi:hypothetical protein
LFIKTNKAALTDNVCRIEKYLNMTSLHQLTRFLIIIRKLKSTIRFSKETLLKAVNTELNNVRDYNPISERTLERDIKILNESPFNMNISPLLFEICNLEVQIVGFAIR